MASLTLFLVLVFRFFLQSCHGVGTFRFDLHHRFSDPVKRWAAERSGADFRPDDWPEKGTVDYYAALANHDRVRRGRGLQDEELTFWPRNSTYKLSNLGYLHYTLVSLGTPNQTFLVALDTGSDLFWVPCDCKTCAPTSSATYGFLQNFTLNVYSPNTSSTSKSVQCSNPLCEVSSGCSGDANTCPYTVKYVSANTSSAGVLVEDVMYLTTEDGQQNVNARILFGCGQVQSGLFLDGGAPDGLFGLGMANNSVPSILSAASLTANSFSMCFGSDDIGRMIFGDKGSSDQDETPFNLKKSRSTYNVSITGLHVNSSLVDTGFSAIFDSGTSFTCLSDPTYTHLSESFNSHTRDKRLSLGSKFPFEYCYLWSPNVTNLTIPSSNLTIPSINLTMKGGRQFPIFNPIILISTKEGIGYCLAIVKSNGLNIIGQNFMTGHRIVFDREKFVLGWKQFNCYDIEDSSTLPINPRNTTAVSPSPTMVPSSHNPEAVSPSPTPVPSSYNPEAVSPSPTLVPSSYNPEATKQTRNGSLGSELPGTPVINRSSHSHSYFTYTWSMLFLLLSVSL